jgi:hypothetical protein
MQRLLRGRVVAEALSAMTKMRVKVIKKSL